MVGAVNVLTAVKYGFASLFTDRAISYRDSFNFDHFKVGIAMGALIHMADVEGSCLILTTGGTGPAPRDVTPEATMNVCQKILPGYGEHMRAESLKQVPTANLSRQPAGIRNNSLIINLPGKPQSIKVCLDAIFTAIAK